MRIIKFDYLARPHFRNNKLSVIYRPIIPIQVGLRRKIYPKNINCFVDSGADFNLMPAFIGEHLELSIKEGERVTHMGIGNVGIVSYRHSVKVAVGDYKFNTDINFSYDNNISILGRYGFFNHFKKLVFNEDKLRLELYY